MGSLNKRIPKIQSRQFEFQGKYSNPQSHLLPFIFFIKLPDLHVNLISFLFTNLLLVILNHQHFPLSMLHPSSLTLWFSKGLFLNLTIAPPQSPYTQLHLHIYTSLLCSFFLIPCYWALFYFCLSHYNILNRITLYLSFSSCFFFTFHRWWLRPSKNSSFSSFLDQIFVSLQLTHKLVSWGRLWPSDPWHPLSKNLIKKGRITLLWRKKKKKQHYLLNVSTGVN